MGRTKSIVIGVVVSIVVIVAIVVPCALLIPGSSNSSSDGVSTTESSGASTTESPGVSTTTENAGTTVPPDPRPAVSFDDIMGSTYRYNSLYPDWDESEDPEYFITTDGKAVVRRSIYRPDENYNALAEADFPNSLNLTYHSTSADAQFIAYYSNVKKVWRHSYTADYVIYDVTNNKKVALNLPGNIQLLKWGPNDHTLAIVVDYTVHTVENFNDDSDSIVQRSEKGEQNKNYYGIPDWMNEEEMIGSNSVLYWSPNSERLAYVHTNDTEVELIEYTWYGDDQYPKTIEIAYPKAGTTIGKAEVWVENIAAGTERQLLPAPKEWLDANTDHYFSRFTWKDDNTCLVTWTNRWQNVSIAHLCTINSTGLFKCSTKNASREEIEGGWVGSFGPFYPMWRNDTEMDYFTIYTKTQSADDGHWQLAYVANDEENFRWMTNTDYDIVGLNYYDGINQYIYFTAAYDLPRRRQIMRVKADVEDEVTAECLTCSLNDTYPDRCGWIDPVFARDGSFVVINCRGPEVPVTILIGIARDGTWLMDEINELEMNTDLTDAISEVKWPRREFGTFQSEKYSKPYQYEIWFPVDFDPNKIKEYPLLIHVYAGPEFQKVTDIYSRGFTQIYMPSMRNMVVASVDGRGSAYEGYKFMREAYLKLGQNEPIDQTDFANHLIGEYPAIDSNNVALWGWSYGGYTTSHTLGYDAGQTFKCGIAVAPLADWTWYDSMYAERYMGDIEKNSEGYKLASIIRGHDLNNFKKSKYVLIHGTADDNVHFQSAAEMEKALVGADVDFDAFFYADEAHSINSGPNANKHIYHQVDIRLSHCLGRVETPYGGPR